jgi:hypothetical protein
MAANCLPKEWRGTFPELHKKKHKIEVKVAQLLEEQLKADQSEGNPSEPKGSGPNRQQRVERLQQKAELIEQWLAENQPKLGAAGREKQSNITDNDSATMMASHGVVHGYNSQALIDGKHQVIVHGEAFGNGQDHIHVPPMLEGTRANLQSIGYGTECLTGKILTADSNYHTQVNLRKCQELGGDAYIPDRKFRNRDPRFDTQKRRRSRRFTLKDFHHDATLDQYSCPMEKFSSCKSKDVSTTVTFIANMWQLKKIAGVVRCGPGASMGRMPNVSIEQSPSASKALISPNRWWRKSRPNRDAGYTRNAWP